jgi:nicotinate-nucleotide pyrophosphorylase (carboxylating)
MNHPDVLALIDLALREDIGDGDVTSNACIPADRFATGRYFAREHCVVAGTELLALVYARFGGVPTQVEVHSPSGDRVGPGQPVATVRGAARTLLACERVTLNFLQRLSGIATNARRYVDAVAGTKAKVLDTRKTTPGLRRLEKHAAAAGGVQNHRMGLYDAVLIKNNHITAAGGIRQALAREFPPGIRVEIEVRTPQDIDEALAAGAKHLLLDNNSPEEAAEQIRRIAGRATVELSGNITLETIRQYAEAGPDYISCGAITHTVRAADFNFRLELCQ